MTTPTPTLAEWLLDRIAEDEAAARDQGADAMMGARWKHYPEAAYSELQALVLTHSLRVLAECAAMRRVVDYREQAAKASRETGAPIFEAQLSAYDATLRALASVYADRDGWREEWRA